VDEKAKMSTAGQTNGEDGLSQGTYKGHQSVQNVRGRKITTDRSKFSNQEKPQGEEIRTPIENTRTTHRLKGHTDGKALGTVTKRRTPRQEG